MRVDPPPHPVALTVAFRALVPTPLGAGNLESWKDSGLPYPTAAVNAGDDPWAAGSGVPALAYPGARGEKFEQPRTRLLYYLTHFLITGQV